MAVLMTPSFLFSNKSYASSIIERGKRCVMRGVVSILPCSISFKISSQSQPSTPPVLKVRFLPYISGRGFCKLCKTYYGHSPIIYCSESYFKDYLSPEFDGYYLWIASYNHEPVLPGEPHYDIWQFSRHGRVPGVWNWVDLNRFADGRTLDDIRIKE